MQELTERKIIGEGQHGQVLKCIHVPLPGASSSQRTVVAVKVFKTATNDAHMYCGRELAMMASCRNRNVTKVRPGTAQQPTMPSFPPRMQRRAARNAGVRPVHPRERVPGHSDRVCAIHAIGMDGRQGSGPRRWGCETGHGLLVTVRHWQTDHRGSCVFARPAGVRSAFSGSIHPFLMRHAVRLA